MTEKQRKQAWEKMERCMTVSHPQVETSAEPSTDRSAVQERMEQVHQKKETPQPVREIHAPAAIREVSIEQLRAALEERQSPLHFDNI
ncbi:hypothetical protein MUK70_06435 [Dyadobacter chenwenxiniae]|uniref:Uncharacterized protein n=1 Tax=Dyadobacter chenwenxiniae TaxID=2906456 RepID=A0A9X1PRG7_9BACT|nr:hypothetical protein [Dyadobacter chenwenxiniae]MCF0065104.1 hypothetical protein [Dyadobacter chenwenxiniae]UON84624.1 hypothetical protein MUK70_06435 [Dyadobacter chenwenxiniae]